MDTGTSVAAATAATAAVAEGTAGLAGAARSAFSGRALIRAPPQGPSPVVPLSLNAFLGRSVCAGSCSSTGCDSTQRSLNADPYNVRAEELAVTACMGDERLVRRSWAEKELVRHFDGRMIAGTPDGMFERWDESLCCVQVVRVPLLSAMDASELEAVLSTIIVTKVVKSQLWLRATQVNPREFIVYCWLPFAVPPAVEAAARTLMERVRGCDARFALELRTPPTSAALFPALFATTKSMRKSTSFSESDVSVFSSESYDDDSDSGDDFEYTWDMIWTDDG